MDFLVSHPAVLYVQATGSRYICDPPVLDTDEDYVVLAKEECRNEFNNYLLKNFFFRTNEDYGITGPTQFQSWRSDYSPDDKRNLIITYNPEWYNLFVEATEFAKEENLLQKEDRIKLFELIMRKYSKTPKIEEPEQTILWWKADWPLLTISTRHIYDTFPVVQASRPWLRTFTP